MHFKGLFLSLFCLLAQVSVEAWLGREFLMGNSEVISVDSVWVNSSQPERENPTCLKLLISLTMKVKEDLTIVTVTAHLHNLSQFTLLFSSLYEPKDTLTLKFGQVPDVGRYHMQYPCRSISQYCQMCCMDIKMTLCNL